MLSCGNGASLALAGFTNKNLVKSSLVGFAKPKYCTAAVFTLQIVYITKDDIRSVSVLFILLKYNEI